VAIAVAAAAAVAASNRRCRRRRKAASLHAVCFLCLPAARARDASVCGVSAGVAGCDAHTHPL
jgi:hypothetical protein